MWPEFCSRKWPRRRGSRARRRRRWCRSSPASARPTPRGSRAWRRSRRWRRTRPCGRSARARWPRAACWSSQLVTSQRTAIACSAPPSSSASASSLSSRARRQHHPVAELHGAAGGGGADAGAGAGDHEHGFVGHRRVSSSAGRVGPRRGRTATPPRRASRACPSSAGHYESFYLKACHPDEPLGVWIRYTVHKRPGARAHRLALVHALRRRGAAARAPQKVDAAGAARRRRRLDQGGGGRASAPGAAVGRAGRAPRGSCASRRAEAPLFHLPRDWMYRAPLPRTKLLSPAPAARFDGSLDGGRPRDRARRLARDGGPQLGRPARRALDLAARPDRRRATGSTPRSARSSSGPLTTPWIANGALSPRRRAPRARRPGPQGRRCARRPSAASSRSAARASRVRGDGRARRARTSSAGSTPTPTAPSTTPSTARSPTCGCASSATARPTRARRCAAAPPTSWACASATTASPIQPFPDG